MDAEGSSPALQVTAHTGGQEHSEWVRFGQPAILAVGGKTVHVMYSWDLMQLPFRIEAGLVKAECRRGVLTLQLPRANADKPQRIAVKVD